MGYCGRIIENGLRLLFPQRCAVCDEVVPFDEGFACNECKKQIKYIENPRCRKCGKQLTNIEDIICYDCKGKNHAYDYGYALYDYHTMRDSMYRFKYGKRAEYAKFYAGDMYRFFHEEILMMKADGIIPVPLHKDRFLQRGYNQAYEIGRELSKVSGIPFYPDIVRRSKYTLPQKGLDEIARQNNLKKAFLITSDDVKLKRVILVDDIYTTGSTIDAVAKELRQHGVGEIYYLALTIGEGL